jgi:hypothetical protein
MPVKRSGHPIGIVSINDITRRGAGKASPVEVTATLAAVSTPRALLVSAA